MFSRKKNCMCRGLQVYDVVGEERKVWLERSLVAKKGSQEWESELHSERLVTMLRESGLDPVDRKKLQWRWLLLWSYSQCENQFIHIEVSGSGFIHLIFAEEKNGTNVLLILIIKGKHWKTDGISNVSYKPGRDLLHSTWKLLSCYFNSRCPC